MRMNKVIACAVSFVATAVCLAAAKPKVSTPVGFTNNLDEVKAARHSNDVVQIDVRIASDGKTSAKSCRITTQFGHEKTYKDAKAYRYRTEDNEFKTQEVGICVTVTPELDDDGMIGLYMTVHAVDELKRKNKREQSPFRSQSMTRRLRLSPGKPTVVQDGDLRVTVTAKVKSS